MKEAVTGVTGKRILIDQWVKIDQRVYIDFFGSGALFWVGGTFLGRGHFFRSGALFWVATVGNRVVKIQKVILPNYVFELFFLIINTPTKKKPQKEPPCYLPLFGTRPQSENFRKTVSRSGLRKGRLWRQISRVLFGFCSAYIYPFERIFSQLFKNVFKIFKKFIT
jgi:hypothetical protein